MARWQLTIPTRRHRYTSQKAAGESLLESLSAATKRRALFYIHDLAAWDMDVDIFLFGSLENFAEFITDSGAPVHDGWTCSSSQSVYRFLEKECRIVPRGNSKEQLARDALQIARWQSEFGYRLKSPRSGYPWNRGYTYGDIIDVGEWLAEIYLDIDLRDSLGGPEDGHDRVLIGAPFWVRTPSLKEVRMYSECDRNQLDNEEETDPEVRHGDITIKTPAKMVWRWLKQNGTSYFVLPRRWE